MLISHKVDFSAKKITREKEGDYIMIEASVHYEDIAILILNVYVLNSNSSKSMKQKLIELKGETDKATIMLGTSIPHFSN